MNPTCLSIEGPGRTHPYLLESGLLRQAGSLVAADGFERCIVLTDEHVEAHWRPVLEAGLEGLRQDWVVVPPGEATKSLEQVRDLYARLLALEVDRRTPVLALGGGMVGDLGGFVAATLLRGLPLYHLPTSLLAMVDSSLGGKTAVDLPEGKNLVGAFYPPRGVWVDPDTLKTLPMREWAGGMAEALKHAILASPDLFTLLEELSELAAPDLFTPEQLEALVLESARVKIDVVARDPWEAGERILLNLGHTLGHALEAAGGYQLLSHGEAVALGLLASVRLSRRRGILEEDLEPWLVALLRAWDLPRAIPASLQWPSVLEALRRDKKRGGPLYTFVLPRRIGEATVVRDVRDEEVREVFDALLQGGRGPGFA